MLQYPNSEAEAHALAAAIANEPYHYANYKCVDCARAIVKAIGRDIDAAVVKLVTQEGQGIVILPSKGLLAATTGQHVGVRIEDTIYDNHHPNGVTVSQWRHLYKDKTGNALLCYERPISDFFGKIFRWREFSAFASNRFQDDDYELE
jgi:hypothetical protein